ncbi:hypothetical protein UCDDS831_g03647 [Diplodia seriata]|uniref:Uncharacterized protein n=1 Tax=Diplodia seriata TaxID=420778 RepID=A0A0G2EI10_9PEZI|nr:hypothetical protein UCDDS831_g03647 [Diplodia seriata]
MTTQRATTEELPSCASPPPRAYPLTPTIPWLGGTAEYLDLLANISITLNDDDDDIIRDHAVDPALVCAADRQLLRVLMHAMRTEGAETCGFESGEDAKGDVSKAQMDAWINTPQDIAEEYFQMHMLDDLKRKKIPRELEGEATQETVVPSGPSEEDAKEIHRNNAYMQLVGAKGTPADSSRARTLEEGTHIKPLQASAPEPKPKVGKRVKWTVCILVVLAIAFGLGFGLSRR